MKKQDVSPGSAGFFHEEDYRKILRFLLSSGDTPARGTIARLATHLRMAPNQLSQILTYKKELLLEQAHIAAHYFGLEETKTEYFLALVQRERAAEYSYKEYWNKKIEALRTKSLDLKERIPMDREITDMEKSRYYSDHHYSLIRICLSLDRYKSRTKLAELFQMDIEQLNEMVNFLISIGLVTEIDQRLDPTDRFIFVGKDSPFLMQHHRNWRLASMNKVSKLTAEDLCFTFAVSVSQKDFLKIRERLVEMIQEVKTKIESSEAEEVVWLNLDWMKLRL